MPVKKCCPRCGSDQTRLVARKEGGTQESWLCSACDNSFTEPASTTEGVQQRVPLRG